MPLLLVDLDNTLVDRDSAFRDAIAAFLTEHGLPEVDVAWATAVDASGYTPRDVVAAAMVDRYGDAVPGTAIRSLLDTGAANRVVLTQPVQAALVVVGILPVDALDVIVAGLSAAGRGGRSDAWVELGQHQLREDRDAQAALASFGAAAEAGDRVGVLEFGRASRWGTPDDQRRARAMLAPLVDEDPDGTVTYQLGLVTGWLGEDVESFRLHQEAAAKGDADAAFELSVLHHNGQGVAADPDASHAWLVKAAELGQFRALYNVAAGYATGGNGFPQDTARSIEYYQRAADAGNGRAAATLGVMCLMGEGMAADPKRAGEWFDDAEELGFDVDDWLGQLDLERPSR